MKEFETPKTRAQLAEGAMEKPEMFKHSWQGSHRVPQSVTMPDGTNVGVGYMRDGNIQLMIEGQPVEATYERVDAEEGWQAIHITYSTE